uniref:3'-5' exonuclease domain-containing protein n=1 Tax=Kalanchoe fedtschenkoi TaxID=63787 RepID=A0A7N0UGJ0_KALFE
MEVRVPIPMPNIHLVSSHDSPELAYLIHSLTRSSLVGLDAEWKPTRRGGSPSSPIPTVSLLQIACLSGTESKESVVFLLDLLTLPLPLIYHLLEDVFLSPHILKLGFRFKQDLVYLSATFRAQGCDPGFDTVTPYLDIAALYSYLNPGGGSGRKSKDTKSLATMCRELLGISLSKELQCSDWSCRPLTEEQKSYAAADAWCLLELFNLFRLRLATEGLDKASRICCGSTRSDNHLVQLDLDGKFTKSSSLNTKPMEDSLLRIVDLYGEKIQLDETNRRSRVSRGRKRQPADCSLGENKLSGLMEDWEGPPPWDPSLGGDGRAKFLCDVMVEGLAKHLRCVGIDAAVPSNKKPEARDLIDQAHREKRVLLTRDGKLLRHEYLIKGQMYKVKSLLKNDQLLEVIGTFQLKIDEDQLMSRCTKCNGSFIQRPLSSEEAVEAAKGFQKIPSCLYNKDIEFWQCRDCRQLYWEGTQYHNAVQKFIDVCKLRE